MAVMPLGIIAIAGIAVISIIIVLVGRYFFRDNNKEE